MVASIQRFAHQYPCPVCGGYDQTERGSRQRCYGYLSSNGEYANCTREEHAGGLLRHEDNTYGHRLTGDCRCGKRHGPRQPTSNGTGRDLIATYDYRDEAREVLFQALRYSPKGFFQRRPDGRGGWIYDLKGVRRVPYRLPELIQADPALPVFVVEGEKDADRLAEAGLVATCNPMGAGKWEDAYSAHFQGRDCVVLPDNDPPGHKHAEQVASSLLAVARSVKVLDLPELPTAGDVNDWLDVHTIDDLKRLVEHTLEWEPPISSNGHRPDDNLEPESFHLTDLGNTSRGVIKTHGQLLYCDAWKTWLRWNGKCWTKDQTLQVMEYVKRTIISILAEAAKEPDDRRKALRKWEELSEGRSHINAIEELARSALPITPEDFDQDPYLVNCKNGTLDLRLGTLREHKPEDLITKLAPVDYEEDATDSLFEDFLDRFLPDLELRDFVRRALGYSLLGRNPERRMFLVYGPTSTGKTTLMEMVASTIGDYATAPQEGAFTASPNRTGPRDDIADLAGARIVLSSELEAGVKLAEGLMKRLTGGVDSIRARFLHQRSFQFRASFTIWLAANERPRLKDTDDAVWARILEIPFLHQISQAERDGAVQEHLCDPEQAGPAVMAWLIQGWLDYKTVGLAIPYGVKNATEAYRLEMNPLAEFLEDEILLGPDCQCANPELWDHYQKWCATNKVKGLGRKGFAQRIGGLEGVSADRTGSRRFWRGLGIIVDEKTFFED